MELTINLLCQATLAPELSALEYFNGRFNYNATPIGSLGCLFLIHINTKNQNPGNSARMKASTLARPSSTTAPITFFKKHKFYPLLRHS